MTDPTRTRWRLVLGRYAEGGLPGALGDAGARRADRALDALYGREYQGRGTRDASLDPSALAIPEWIREVRTLFPAEVCEVVTRHALDRYGLAEVLTDPEVLRRLEPDRSLLELLLTFKGRLPPPVLALARAIVRKVVEELRERLARELRPVLSGRNEVRRSGRRVARNLDVRRTVRANLKHYDPERRRIVARTLYFRSRATRYAPWHVVIAVDCSGSMIGSVIHAAVMASIFHALPSVRVRLVAFDTAVVDLSDAVADPAEVLMSVHLGGGTDICRAVRYCAEQVTHPARTVLVVITDFFEGGDQAALLATVRRLRGDGVRVLGLAALDEEARPVYDRDLAARWVDAGAGGAALTPGRLAEWVAKALS